MRVSRLSWFDPPSKTFLVPTKVTQAVARSRSQGRPFGRRAWRASLDGDEHGRTLDDIGRFARRSRAGLRVLVGLLLTVVLGAMAPVATCGAERNAEPSSIGAIVDEAARRFRLPHGWIYAVIAAESGGDAGALSSKGAMGLMQLMPETWRALSVQHRLGADPFDRRANVLAGAAYLRELLDQFGPEGFLAAYNAGPGRYAESRAGRRRLPAETIAYVAKVERSIADVPAPLQSGSAPRASDWRASKLFIIAPSLSASGEAASLFPHAADRVSP